MNDTQTSDTKYESSDFWHDFLRSLGYTPTKDYGGYSFITWYKKGQFLFGFSVSPEYNTPYLAFVYQGETDKEMFGHLSIPDEVLSFIRAMADPDSLPLFIHTDWTQRIVKAYFEEH